MRAIDVLETLPYADTSRLAVIGHSLGGHNAIFAALFDPRIKVIVSSSGWTPPPFMWTAASYYLPAPTDHIADILTANLRRWRAAFPNKPLLVSEYGAGSYPGLHALPGSGAPSEFSAELREEILKATWVAFDELRKDGELQGEQMHALHDFKQRGGTYHDVGGMNFKGLYARDRSPKDHARVALSERYGRIARGEDEGRCS